MYSRDRLRARRVQSERGAELRRQHDAVATAAQGLAEEVLAAAPLP